MSRIKQSVVYWSFTRQATAEELIKAAAEIGFESVEMLPEEYWEKVKAEGLQIAIIGGHQSLRDGLQQTLQP